MAFKSLRDDLDRNIKGLSDFKIVMQTISTIQTTTMTMELRIKEIQETYNVLEEHSIKTIYHTGILLNDSYSTSKLSSDLNVLSLLETFPYGDILMSYHLERRWKNLFNSAFYRQTTLEPTKMKFAEMTFNEINMFCDEVI
uniref:CSON011057 protein n=1 Tax=Culicoides sonorensis TaxID=179676 RepID=A0A336M301_CULSO